MIVALVYVFAAALQAQAQFQSRSDSAMQVFKYWTTRTGAHLWNLTQRCSYLDPPIDEVLSSLELLSPVDRCIYDVHYHPPTQTFNVTLGRQCSALRDTMRIRATAYTNLFTEMQRRQPFLKNASFRFHLDVTDATRKIPELDAILRRPLLGLSVPSSSNNVIPIPDVHMLGAFARQGNYSDTVPWELKGFAEGGCC
jgi:hypothetical protein